MAASVFAPLLQHDFAFSPEHGVAQPVFAGAQPVFAGVQLVFAADFSTAGVVASDFSVTTFSVDVFVVGTFCAETVATVKANNNAITDKIIEILFMRLSLSLALQR